MNLQFGVMLRLLTVPVHWIMLSPTGSFGKVPLHAFACGTPFIACAGQGMDDLVPDAERELWLAAPGDARDLAAKIVAYYERRPRQHLAGEIAIDSLVRSFLGEVFGA